MKNKEITYYPEKSEYAKKTLERVLQEWITGQEKITWTVIEPNTKGLFLPIFFILFILFIIVIFPILYELYFHHNIKQALNEILFYFIILSVFFIFSEDLRRYKKTIITINRKKKKGKIKPPRFTFTDRKTKRIKYGQNIELNYFRLPENEKKQYRKIRTQLQNLITKETGWQFEHDHNESWLSDEVRELFRGHVDFDVDEI